ncbi:MAG TPA: alpha-L-fucosidase, partial [Planctomycetota bacterium]|nr:alpha-L-fucosidase [Planctomycetota bacterium]
ADPAAALARPSPEQAAWQDLELGMFVHLAPQTWQDSESDTLATPLADIDPERLDTAQWVRTAQALGARYIVFVAKHEGGFCWWQTTTTDFSVAHTPWRAGKGDVLQDLSASCRQQGMKLGVYLSPADRKHGIGVGGKAATKQQQQEYEQLFRRQLTEVLSNYGEMSEVWFDGSLVFDVGDLLQAHAPRAVVFQGPQASIRWVGNEDGVAPDPAWNTVVAGNKRWGDYTGDDGDPTGDRWLPNECDARMRATWFWNSHGQDSLKTTDRLLAMYERSVGHGAVLLLNNTPDRSGAIPAADVARSAEFGAEVARRFGTAITDTRGKGTRFELQPPAPRMIDVVMAMEDIQQGERVRRYAIEGLVAGQWQPLAVGTAIGHKKIDRFAPVEVAAVRFTVLEAVGEPVLRRIALFDTRKQH